MGFSMSVPQKKTKAQKLQEAQTQEALQQARGREQGTYEHAKSLDLLDRQNAMEMYNKILGLSQGTGDTTSQYGRQIGLGDIEGRLANLLDNPESIRDSGAYKFRLDQGADVLQRQMGAKGMLNSGNRLADLTKYGQDMATQEYGDQFGRLSSLLGNYQQSRDSNIASLMSGISGGAIGRGGTNPIWQAYGVDSQGRHDNVTAATQGQSAVDVANAQKKKIHLADLKTGGQFMAFG